MAVDFSANFQTIGLIGGTGDLGSALAVHLARKYGKVLVGSRNLEKAKSAVQGVVEEKGGADYLRERLVPSPNEAVVQKSDIVILTVPYESALQTVRQLAGHFRSDGGGQLLINAAAAVKKSDSGEFFAPIGEKSLTNQIREALPGTVEVAAAFQTIPANVLYKEEVQVTADVLVACEGKEVFREVSELISAIPGLRPLHLGSLELSRDAESLTSTLLNIAIKNRLKSPTIKVVSF